MQNAQNTEIQQRVINLVELYRTKVGKESQIAKWKEEERLNWEAALADYCEKQIENGSEGILYETAPEIPEEWNNALDVDRQLIGHFYSVVAGERAKKEVVRYFLPDYYDTTVFSEEDDIFLRSHFRVMVNYIMQAFCIPNEVLNLIKERAELPEGSTIYNPFSCYAEFPRIFNGCRFICEAEGAKTWRWAWMEVALYANGVDAIVIEDGDVPKSYDAVVANIRFIDEDGEYNSVKLSKIHQMYENLKEGGKMVLIMRRNCFKGEKTLFAKLLSVKGSLEIIRLPDFITSLPFCEIVALIATKGKGNKLALVDTRSAYKEKDAENLTITFDMDAFYSILNGNGKDVSKMEPVHSWDIESGINIPQLYVVEKPFEEELPVLLSELCSFVTTRISKVDQDLPQDTPWIMASDLSTVYKGELIIDGLRKANCQNNPMDWKIREKKIANFYSGTLGKEERPPMEDFMIYHYRDSIFLDGSKDAVLFTVSSKGEVTTALLRVSNRPIAVSSDISVICPKNGGDALFLLALLHMPVVIRQLLVCKALGITNYQDAILVPTDKRVIDDEIIRIKREETAIKEMENKFSVMKTEYINEVRMRKHDMGQYIFELLNIEDLMRYYFENRDREKDYIKQIEDLLINFRSSVGELSTLLDNLSKEEQFGEPELFDIVKFMENLKTRYCGEGINVTYTSDKMALLKYHFKQLQDKIISRYRSSFYSGENIPNKIMDVSHPDENIDVSYSDEHIDESYSDEHIDESYSDEHIDESYTDEHIDESYSDEHIDESYSDEHIDESYSDEHIDESYSDEHIDESYSDEHINESYSDEHINESYSDEHIDESYSDEHIDESYPDEHIDESYPDEHIDESYSYERYYDDKIPFPSIMVNTNDFQRMVNNIVDNARKHGFTDPNRKDYEINVVLSIDNDKNMFQIDFRNNGKPLPKGMNKMRYGIKGEKAGKTAGTGIGGNYVKSFVGHYGGDYDIFMENGWTVVRICLPIK